MWKTKINIMFRIIVVALFIIASQNGNSQSVNLASEQYPELRYYPLKGEIFYSDYQRVKGNAYLTDDWIMGDIEVAGGKIIPDVKFKVDIFSHHLLVYNDYLKRTVKPDTKYIQGFSIDYASNRRVFKQVEYDFGYKKNNPYYFLEVLNEGRISFYKINLKTILPLATKESGYTDEFFSATHYYIFYKGKYEIARLRRSYLIMKFPEYKSEIKNYSRQNKLKIRKESGFTQMVAHLSKFVFVE